MNARAGGEGVEGYKMGRAKLKIVDTLISVLLQTGCNAVHPMFPLHDVEIIDARVKDGVVELLLDGRQDELPGPHDATIDTAPDLEFFFKRRAVIDDLAGIDLAVDLLRIVDAAGPKGGRDDAAPLRLEAELALGALKRIPTVVVEKARAKRIELGETIPPPDPADVTDEVPGA